ncbi:MAG: ABC transporter permease [Mesorhizobium sp.]|nr:MAG: ABC transporter permease [Mesorhizobium sp.]RWL34193.1 MAG: ABC transporter permease [Mesorhizobium sp.]RWL35609.1 MAG: ABC transporter permease [Mesorhizobium sp.]RWL41019.1 MAG: ABC transporter permease [Mesorhizobium sp.]RWL52215.1 MAG: ABC transporter permease [Mesorhizobium sp.]
MTQLQERVLRPSLLKAVADPILQRQWMDTAVPVMVLVAVSIALAATIPDYFGAANVQQILRGFAPPAFVAIAMGWVIFAGGIDLSVGAVFAVANFVALMTYGVLALPFWAALGIVLLVGATIGAANGLLIAYVKTRPFLTTIVMLIILRACYEKLVAAYTSDIANVNMEGAVWDALGGGRFAGIPVSFLCLLVCGVLAHLYITRCRGGMHMMAVGSSRKAARHAGISVPQVIFKAYVVSAVLASIAGFLYAARQNSVGSGTGLNWEINALSAVVLGGNSLAGGRGSIARTLIGALTIFLLVNGLVQIGVHGSLTSTLVGGILLCAVGFNVQWVKHRSQRARQRAKPVADLLPAPDAG